MADRAGNEPPVPNQPTKEGAQQSSDTKTSQDIVEDIVLSGQAEQQPVVSTSPLNPYYPYSPIVSPLVTPAWLSWTSRSPAWSPAHPNQPAPSSSSSSSVSNSNSFIAHMAKSINLPTDDGPSDINSNTVNQSSFIRSSSGGSGGGGGTNGGEGWEMDDDIVETAEQTQPSMSGAKMPPPPARKNSMSGSKSFEKFLRNSLSSSSASSTATSNAASTSTSNYSMQRCRSRSFDATTEAESSLPPSPELKRRRKSIGDINDDMEVGSVLQERRGLPLSSTAATSLSFADSKTNLLPPKDVAVSSSTPNSNETAFWEQMSDVFTEGSSSTTNNTNTTAAATTNTSTASSNNDVNSTTVSSGIQHTNSLEFSHTSSPFDPSSPLISMSPIHYSPATSPLVPVSPLLQVNSQYDVPAPPPPPRDMQRVTSEELTGHEGITKLMQQSITEPATSLVPQNEQALPIESVNKVFEDEEEEVAEEEYEEYEEEEEDDEVAYIICYGLDMDKEKFISLLPSRSDLLEDHARVRSPTSSSASSSSTSSASLNTIKCGSPVTIEGWRLSFDRRSDVYGVGLACLRYWGNDEEGIENDISSDDGFSDTCSNTQNRSRSNSAVSDCGSDRPFSYDTATAVTHEQRYGFKVPEVPKEVKKPMIKSPSVVIPAEAVIYPIRAAALNALDKMYGCPHLSTRIDCDRNQFLYLPTPNYTATTQSENYKKNNAAAAGRFSLGGVSYAARVSAALSPSNQPLFVTPLTSQLPTRHYLNKLSFIAERAGLSKKYVSWLKEKICFDDVVSHMLTTPSASVSSAPPPPPPPPPTTSASLSSSTSLLTHAALSSNNEFLYNQEMRDTMKAVNKKHIIKTASLFRKMKKLEVTDSLKLYFECMLLNSHQDTFSVSNSKTNKTKSPFDKFLSLESGSKSGEGESLNQVNDQSQKQLLRVLSSDFPWNTLASELTTSSNNNNNNNNNISSGSVDCGISGGDSGSKGGDKDDLESENMECEDVGTVLMNSTANINHIFVFGIASPDSQHLSNVWETTLLPFIDKSRQYDAKDIAASTEKISDMDDSDGTIANTTTTNTDGSGLGQLHQVSAAIKPACLKSALLQNHGQLLNLVLDKHLLSKDGSGGGVGNYTEHINEEEELFDFGIKINDEEEEKVREVQVKQAFQQGVHGYIVKCRDVETTSAFLFMLQKVTKQQLFSLRYVDLVTSSSSNSTTSLVSESSSQSTSCVGGTSETQKKVLAWVCHGAKKYNPVYEIVDSGDYFKYSSRPYQRSWICVNCADQSPSYRVLCDCGMKKGTDLNAILAKCKPLDWNHQEKMQNKLRKPILNKVDSSKMNDDVDNGEKSPTPPGSPKLPSSVVPTSPHAKHLYQERFQTSSSSSSFSPQQRAKTLIALYGHEDMLYHADGAGLPPPSSLNEQISKGFKPHPNGGGGGGGDTISSGGDVNFGNHMTDLSEPPSSVGRTGWRRVLIEKASAHPERPDRLRAVLRHFRNLKFFDRMEVLSCRPATNRELLMAHPQSHINKIEATRNTAPIEGSDTEYWKDAYACPGSAQAALIAAGTTIELVLKITEDCVTPSSNNRHGESGAESQQLSGENSVNKNSSMDIDEKPPTNSKPSKCNNAVALVRPPGHHAETNICMGFCYYNNAALAAYAALNRKNPQTGENPISRVLIVDWDVHHGNGTQRIFEDDPRVLYVSLHRYPFYPNTGAFHEVGKGCGEGFTVNIGWSEGGMGDVEYLAAFRQIIMPIASSFDPQFVIISAGFDAAAGDPLGGCSLSPTGYAHMTHQLMQLANGRVMLLLEGGYNLRSIASSAEACIRIMLGELPPPLPEKDPCYILESADEAIMKTAAVHMKYWPALHAIWGSSLEFLKL